ncbi:hypothetical protein MPNT_10195 [Candidatus Methylacidithermus pantelleriae]|uniref:Uncharacterized protein n=1 Tax=Candidatus Methylacidithermus pantelleriae TaxID=2744239 RepID=A0A8J2FMN1_9BACT|nr:hypothetical protein MPNT_10195 [Candidatus Methylacidithermus pantelleriae]
MCFFYDIGEEGVARWLLGASRVRACTRTQEKLQRRACE